MSHEELKQLIRSQDRLVLQARQKRDEARAELEVFMRVFDVASEASIEDSDEYVQWRYRQQKYLESLIDFNREIANA
jgi:predicted RNA-binding protein